MFIDLRALPSRHGAVIKCINQLPESVLPHDVSVLQWVYVRQFLKVLLLIRGIRNPVFCTINAVNDFCIGVRQAKYSCRVVARQSEFRYQDE